MLMPALALWPASRLVTGATSLDASGANAAMASEAAATTPKFSTLSCLLMRPLPRSLG